MNLSSLLGQPLCFPIYIWDHIYLDVITYFARVIGVFDIFDDVTYMAYNNSPLVI